MSGMRWKHELNERTLDSISPDCCGPFNGVWNPKRSYWVCDYHCGYNDGLNDCRDPS